jgi:hypothetical protein
VLNLIKNLTKRALGPKLIGVLDYCRFPQFRQSWGGPLNGQQQRQSMVSALIKQLNISVIVETGTFRGTTTEFFADLCPGPVFTIEADQRLYGYSRARLFRHRNVVSLLDDSRNGLRGLIGNKRLQGKRILFYLDAHWGTDLPLGEEIDLIFSNWDEAVVLVDDFQVPGDPGYRYDDYGEGKALTLKYIKKFQSNFNLKVFFPTAESSQETGAKRGCVLLVANPLLSLRIAALEELRIDDSEGPD